MKKGYVQVYTGDGKGKTTAALGLAMRAAGAGLKVYVAQFVKGMDYAELHSCAAMRDRITVRQYGTQQFVREQREADAEQLARTGLRETREILLSGAYEVVILDEANVATFYELFDVEDLLDVIHAKPDHVELVITGRNADARIIERADLVTEMREIKHYYVRGITARPGIEY
jgi:cob(I)alamin adenosyltransferase